MSLIESLLDLVAFVEAEMMIGHGNTIIYRVLHFKFESKKPFSVIRRKSDLSEDLAFD